MIEVSAKDEFLIYYETFVTVKTQNSILISTMAYWNAADSIERLCVII